MSHKDPEIRKAYHKKYRSEHKETARASNHAYYWGYTKPGIIHDRLERITQLIKDKVGPVKTNFGSPRCGGCRRNRKASDFSQSPYVCDVCFSEITPA